METTNLERKVDDTGDNRIKNNKQEKKIKHKKSNRQKWRVEKIHPDLANFPK